MQKLGSCLQPIVLGAALLLSTGGLAADWPQFRGPNRDGISQETGLLKDWPEAGPRLVWKTTGLGNGYSTVSIEGNRIYTTGDSSNSSFVIALNLADGKQVWTAKLGKPGAPGWGGFAGPRATPTIEGGLLFTVDQWGEMVCLDKTNGREQWRKDFTKDFGGQRPEWGFSESPLVDGDKVVVTPGGSKGAIVALDKKSGAVIWQTKDFTDPAHYSSLILAEIGGVRQYIQLTAESVVGVAAADGKLLWRAERKGKTAVIPTPIYSEGFVYVTSGYQVGCNLFKISAADGKFSAEQVFANKVMENQHGGVIKVGDYVYGFSDGKGWTCQNFKTGEAKWQEKTKVGKGSLVYADGHFYLRQEDKQGTVALIEATPEGYKEHGRFEQPDRSGKNSWPHPVVADGRLYLRDQDVLLCYDVKSK
ncbi:MAG TPA: PQQ-binding-like beta-propeller repeat protein [Candidatus Sulfotelmatobacter sp.]|nr:PQQ-binding-like beta-propeller repeat protein [Candidatus Sulfotelmatobacter sp.]HWI59514.1 PQQ-binding-like beta-propeller repeat protein [Bacillota bacterium]